MLKHCHTIFHTQLNQEKKHASIHKNLKMQTCNAYIRLEVSIYDDTSRKYKLTIIVIHF